MNLSAPFHVVCCWSFFVNFSYIRLLEVLPRICWMEFDKTWQEAYTCTQCCPTSSHFSGQSENKDGRPGLWLAETFLTDSPLQSLNRFYKTLTRGKFSKCPLPNFFRADWNTKMAVPSLLIDRHFQLLLCNCSTEFHETWQETSTKNVLNECPLSSFCFFRANQRIKIAALASDWLRHFQFLFCHQWNLAVNKYTFLV